MQSRRCWLFAAALGAACGNPNGRRELLPMELGEWRRKAVENIPGEQMPEDIRSQGYKRARRAFYESGANRLQAIVYEMNHQTVAFEMTQKWRPQEGKMAFHEGAYFVVLDGGDAAAKRSLAGQIGKVLQH